MKGHTINRQIFEFTCRSEDRASGVQREIVHYVADAVNTIAAAVLDAAGAGEHYVIDQLEIDLGDVPADGFGDADMLQTFRQRLLDQVRQRVPAGAAPGGRAGEDSPAWAVTQTFLLHGDVPWWLDKSRPIDVEQWLEKLMQTHPAALLAWLARVPDSATIRQRLLTQYRTAGRSLVRALAAGVVSHAAGEFAPEPFGMGVEGLYPDDFRPTAGYRLEAAALYQMLLTRRPQPVSVLPARGPGGRQPAGRRSLAGWFRYWKRLGLAPADGVTGWDTPMAAGGQPPSGRVPLRAVLQALPLETVRALLREARAEALRKAEALWKEYSELGDEIWDPVPSGTELQTWETSASDDNTRLSPPVTATNGQLSGPLPAPEPNRSLPVPRGRTTDEAVFPDGLAGGVRPFAETHRQVQATGNPRESDAIPRHEATGFLPGERSGAESPLLADDPSVRTPPGSGLPREVPATVPATGDPAARTWGPGVPPAGGERVRDTALAADPFGRGTGRWNAGSGGAPALPVPAPPHAHNLSRKFSPGAGAQAGEANGVGGGDGQPPATAPAGQMPGKAHTLAALLARATGEAIVPGEPIGGGKPPGTYRLATAMGMTPGHDAMGNRPETANHRETSNHPEAGNRIEAGDHAKGAGNPLGSLSPARPGTVRWEGAAGGAKPFPGHAPREVPGHVPFPRDPKGNGPAAPAGKVAGTGQAIPGWNAADNTTGNGPLVSPTDVAGAASGLPAEREPAGATGNPADPVAARREPGGVGSPADRRTGVSPAVATDGVQAAPSGERFAPRSGGYRVGLPVPVRRLAERVLVRLQAQADGQKRQRILRLEAARQVLEHPYLFEYELLQCFAAPPPGNPAAADAPAPGPASRRVSSTRSNLRAGRPAGSPAAEPVPGPGQAPGAVFGADIRALRGKVQAVLAGLSAAHAAVLHDVLRKQKFETAGEKNVVRQVLLKLPAGALRLFQFFTQLSREEMAQLFADAKDAPVPAARVPGREGASRYAPAPAYPAAEAGRRILLENAGLCLLTPYLPTLFNRLGYLEGKVFKHCAAAHRAVYLLQYLASGEAAAPEFLLQLNKLLAGLEADAAVLPGCRLTKAERTEADGLIASAVSYWKALKNTSADGLRQSFLRRKGILQEKEEHWLLQVERREYDLLLDSLPWGFGIVKFPWMKKHIQVAW